MVLRLLDVKLRLSAFGGGVGEESIIDGLERSRRPEAAAVRALMFIFTF